jgi:hypothetical protein
MSNVRKLVLLAVMALAAMALMAPAASAQMEPAEVSHEELAGNSHCNPCVVHAVNETGIVLELFGEVVSVCNNEFNAEIGENGVGELDDQTLTGPNCGITPCADEHWPIEVWEAGLNDFRLEAEFCVNSPLFGVVDCHLESVRIDRDPVDDHLAEFTALAEPCEETSDIHVTGHWNLEPDDQGTLEVDHM